MLLASLGACSLALPIASLQERDPELTGSIQRRPSEPGFPLEGEDWRRAQAALSLAVDPQGPGLPVNWDNPASKRRGSFVQTGNLALADKTVCRPFLATIADPTGPASETKLSGQACRTGPGEWAVESFQRAGDTASLREAGKAAAFAPAQPLPARSPPMLLSGDRRF